MEETQRLKRRAWRGAFLRSLGHASWAVEQTPSGISFLGGRHQAPFSVWTGPARLTSTLGFATIAVPLAGGRVARLAGVATHDAAGFITSANAAFREHVLGQFAAAEDELSALFEVALVHGCGMRRNWVFDVAGYALFAVQRTDCGRAQASIRLRAVQPMATSACWAAKERARRRRPINPLYRPMAVSIKARFP